MSPVILKSAVVDWLPACLVGGTLIPALEPSANPVFVESSRCFRAEICIYMIIPFLNYRSIIFITFILWKIEMPDWLSFGTSLSVFQLKYLYYASVIIYFYTV